MTTTRAGKQAAARVALVTGAAHGMGRAIAMALALDGWRIALHYAQGADDAADTAAELEALGAEVHAFQGDLSVVADIERVFAQLDARFGRLDVLVNNAGLMRAGALEDVTEDAFDAVFSLNVKGTLFCAREASRRMGHGGRIVNISSSRAHFAAPGTSVYAASKSAVEMMTAIWARELGSRGITVNAIAPGPVSPGMFDRAPPLLQAAARAASPLGQIGTADDIAEVVRYLCSDEARWISGQVLLANGGATI